MSLRFTSKRFSYLLDLKDFRSIPTPSISVTADRHLPPPTNILRPPSIICSYPITSVAQHRVPLKEVIGYRILLSTSMKQPSTAIAMMLCFQVLFSATTVVAFLIRDPTSARHRGHSSSRYFAQKKGRPTNAANNTPLPPGLPSDDIK